ncbi:MAG: electron transfer flavoprotein subunit alpha/FixB family protein [Corynebacterium sp.]|nr:electron transfer flavoprotein subunit alpha/FixB family protein [Corynebacterium sp.]
MSTAYILVEYTGDQVLPATAELITAAKVFGTVTAVVVGAPGTHEPLTPQLAALGADAIVAATGDDLDARFVIPATDALSMLAASAPAPILISGGVTGNEIAGRLAARLASGVLCDVVQVNADRTATMSIFGDSIQVSSAVGGASPIYALRPGAVELPDAPTPGTGTVTSFALPAASVKDATVTNFVPAVKGDRPELASAKVVVAGGRGVESEENFHTEVEALADALGGAVGVTRDVVDLGWYAAPYQVGQTGVTVSPDVYIGLGVSGAIQHVSGMQTANKIIVVNNDEDAPFFQIADLGVVGDLHEIVPLVLAEIANRK